MKRHLTSHSREKSHLGNGSNAFLSLTDSALFTEQEKAEDASEVGSKVDSKEVDARQTHGVVGSLKLKSAEMEVTEDNLEAHEDFSEEAVDEFVGTDTVEVEEIAAVDLATSRNGFSGKEKRSEPNRKQQVEETVEEGELLLQPIEEEQLQQNHGQDLVEHGEKLQQNGQDLEKLSCDGEGVRLMQHNGKKSHECTHCRKSFTQTDDLERHMTIHTGEKSHSCAQCSKSFNHGGNLKQHLRTHSRKVHNCAPCSKSFSQAGHMKRHLIAHSGENPHKCEQCNYATTQASTLKMHIMMHAVKPLFRETILRIFPEICDRNYR